MREHGGAAFPSFERWEQYGNDDRLHEVQVPVGGMTLRDYFAGQALAGGMVEFFRTDAAWANYDEFAKSVYLMADAMLKERAK